MGTRVQGAHPQTVPARLEVRGDIGDYAKAAARILAPGGIFGPRLPSDQLSPCLTRAARSRSPIITIAWRSIARSTRSKRAAPAHHRRNFVRAAPAESATGNAAVQL